MLTLWIKHCGQFSTARALLGHHSFQDFQEALDTHPALLFAPTLQSALGTVTAHKATHFDLMTYTTEAGKRRHAKS